MNQVNNWCECNTEKQHREFLHNSGSIHSFLKTIYGIQSISNICHYASWSGVMQRYKTIRASPPAIYVLITDLSIDSIIPYQNFDNLFKIWLIYVTTIAITIKLDHPSKTVSLNIKLITLFDVICINCISWISVSRKKIERERETAR